MTLHVTLQAHDIELKLCCIFFFFSKFPTFPGFYTGLALPPCGPAPRPCGSAPQIPGPPSFTAVASSRLQDKHQKLREGRRLASFLPSLLHNPQPASPPTSNLHHFLCGRRGHDDHSGSDDSNKPKGKRPCKTKHTEGEETYGGGASYDIYNEKVGRTLSFLVCRGLLLFFFRISSLRLLASSLLGCSVKNVASNLNCCLPIFCCGFKVISFTGIHLVRCKFLP